MNPCDAGVSRFCEDFETFMSAASQVKNASTSGSLISPGCFFVMTNDKAFDQSGISALGTICIVFQAHHIAHLIREFSRFLVSINLLIFHNKLRYIQKCQKSTTNILIADIIQLVLNT
jgi:hypothetical protein